MSKGPTRDVSLRTENFEKLFKLDSKKTLKTFNRHQKKDSSFSFHRLEKSQRSRMKLSDKQESPLSTIFYSLYCQIWAFFTKSRTFRQVLINIWELAFYKSTQTKYERISVDLFQTRNKLSFSWFLSFQNLFS